MKKETRASQDQKRIEKLENHIQQAILIVDSYWHNRSEKNKNATEKEFIAWLERSKIIINEQ